MPQQGSTTDGQQPPAMPQQGSTTDGQQPPAMPQQGDTATEMKEGECPFSVGEILKVATVFHNVYNGGSVDDYKSVSYEDALSYATTNGLTSTTYSDLTAHITEDEALAILNAAVPESALDDICKLEERTGGQQPPEMANTSSTVTNTTSTGQGNGTANQPPAPGTNGAMNGRNQSRGFSGQSGQK